MAPLLTLIATHVDTLQYDITNWLRMQTKSGMELMRK